MYKFLNIILIGSLFLLWGVEVSNAITDTQGQGLNVTVDNGLVVVPDTPIITGVDNIDADKLDLNVKVGDSFASETLNFTILQTNNFDGDIVNLNISQISGSDAFAILPIHSLEPGTEYSFVVSYARSSGVYSGQSNVYVVRTLLEPPVLNDIVDITDNSAELDIIVDSGLVGVMMDFLVEVEEGNGHTYTIKITKEITGGHINLNIEDLSKDSKYTFKVKYARANTDYFSDFSNSQVITTNKDVAELDKPIIKNIQNITQNSAELVVEVNNHNGEKLDFVVFVTNEKTGTTFKIDFTETVSNDGRVILALGGLDSGTEYTFKVKYALRGDDKYSDYSKSKTIRALYTSNNENIAICFNKQTIVIKEFDLQSYLNRGATKGECGTEANAKMITVCHNGHTISIVEAQLQDILIKGGYIGECEGVIGNVKKDSNFNNSSNKPKTGKEKIISLEKKDKYEKVGIIGAIAGSVATGIVVAMPLFMAMPGTMSGSLLLRVLELFGVIGRKKEENNWGVVFDNDTHMPIVAVKIILLDETGKELITTYSDKDGRFGFLVEEGEYMLQIFKKGYTLFTEKTNDRLYGKLYNGKKVVIGRDNIISINIALKTEKINWTEFSKKSVRLYKFSVIMKYIFIALYILGFGATIIITIFYPSIFNFIILGIYITLVGTSFLRRKKHMVS